MNRAWYWLPPATLLLLAAVVLRLSGCGGTSPGITTGAKTAAECLAVGETALADGKLDAALAAFDSAVEKDPDSAEAHERRAQAYLRQHNFDKAIADCEEALRINGKLAAAYFTRGQAEMSLGAGQVARALEDFSKALDLKSDKVEYLTARGTLYQQMADAGAAPEQVAKWLDAAVKDFDRALKIDGRNTTCLMRRAAIYLELGDHQAAIEDSDKALDVAPNLAAARVIRARGLTEAGEYTKAVADCDAAIALDDKQMDGYVARAAARVEKSSTCSRLKTSPPATRRPTTSRRRSPSRRSSRATPRRCDARRSCAAKSTGFAACFTITCPPTRKPSTSSPRPSRSIRI